MMPKFVYYSNYGNLSSKIYLPHALRWIKGEKIQGIDTNDEQVRTLNLSLHKVNYREEDSINYDNNPIVFMNTPDTETTV